MFKRSVRVSQRFINNSHMPNSTVNTYTTSVSLNTIYQEKDKNFGRQKIKITWKQLINVKQRIQNKNG